MNDTSVGSMTMEEHPEDLNLFHLLGKARAILKFWKHSWGTQEETILIHRGIEDEIWSTCEDVKAIKDY